MTPSLPRRWGAVLVVVLACRTEAGTVPTAPTAPGTTPDTAPPAAPATLRVFPGQQGIGLMLGGQMRLPVTLQGARGDTLRLPASFTLVSRNPAVVSVDSATSIRARAMGGTWVVGTVVVDGRTLIDSLGVSVICTSELRTDLTPQRQTIAVGESFTPSMELSGCGGQLQISDTFRWTPLDSTVVRVDSVSGRTTGLRAGQTVVVVRGARYGTLGGVSVTVR